VWSSIVLTYEVSRRQFVRVASRVEDGPWLVGTRARGKLALLARDAGVVSRPRLLQQR
jgi:hypothetical protein